MTAAMPLITFADNLDLLNMNNFNGLSMEDQTFTKSHIWDSSSAAQICISEDTSSFEILPHHPYTFNPGIYEKSSLTIPRDLVQINSVENNKTVIKCMPHWNYHKYNLNDQEQFISKYFPEKLSLYRYYKHPEERNNLFIYIWLYVNGGLYVSSDYEILKPLDEILDFSNTADLYFMFDHERYISEKFIASQPFCGFWLEVINLMEKRKTHRYPILRDQIDRNTGRGVLTDSIDDTKYKYEILPRSSLYPYNPCDTNYDKDSYLRPSYRNLNFMTYMKCQTGSTDELLYMTGAIIIVIIIMVIIAIITQ